MDMPPPDMAQAESRVAAARAVRVRVVIVELLEGVALIEADVPAGDAGRSGIGL
jgi:hypothetical protein